MDASAMTAYLNAEPGGDIVRDMLSDSDAICYAHAVNLCEVYYDTLRAKGKSRANLTIRTLYSDGIIERRDMSRKFWHKIGDLKARGRISLADCFCIILAQELGGEVVTADHHEFDALVALNIVPIQFIR